MHREVRLAPVTICASEGSLDARGGQRVEAAGGWRASGESWTRRRGMDARAGTPSGADIRDGRMHHCGGLWTHAPLWRPWTHGTTWGTWNRWRSIVVRLGLGRGRPGPSARGRGVRVAAAGSWDGRQVAHMAHGTGDGHGGWDGQPRGLAALHAEEAASRPCGVARRSRGSPRP